MEARQYNRIKKCPYCAEEILVAAIRCKHCKSDLDKPLTHDPIIGPPITQVTQPVTVSIRTPFKILLSIVILVIAIPWFFSPSSPKVSNGVTTVSTAAPDALMPSKTIKQRNQSVVVDSTEDAAVLRKQTAAAKPTANHAKQEEEDDATLMRDARRVRDAVIKFARNRGETEEEFYVRVNISRSNMAAFAIAIEQSGSTIEDAVSSMSNLSDSMHSGALSKTPLLN